MTRYDLQLTNRSRVWGLLVRYARAGGPAPPERVFEREPDDVRALVDRLVTGGLAEETDAGVGLTRLGERAAEATFESGRVPAVVMHDPDAWRLRAWQTMRIHRVGFTAADVARTADAPSYNAVQRYCRDLAKAGVLRTDGFDAPTQHQRFVRYRVVRDDGPAEPLGTSPDRARETDPDRPWRRRAWSAVWRLGRLGVGFCVAEVAASAGVPESRARLLLEELVEGGAVDRVDRRGLPRGGWEWVYGLAAEARQRGLAIASRESWRDKAYRALRSDRLTAQAVADVGSVGRPTAYRLCEALVRAGFADVAAVEGEGARGPKPNGYRLADDAPDQLPDDLVLRWPQAGAETDRPEVATCDA